MNIALMLSTAMEDKSIADYRCKYLWILEAREMVDSTFDRTYANYDESVEAIALAAARTIYDELIALYELIGFACAARPS